MSNSDKPVVRFVEVGEDEQDQRIDNYLIRQLKGLPRSRLYRLLRKGEVRVNKGRIDASYRLQAGDTVRIPPVRLAESNSGSVAPGNKVLERIDAAIIHEDDGLMVIDKPSGLAVHGGSGLNYGLIEALRQLRPKTQGLELVHRLDRDTSGCILIAKKRSVLRELHQLMRQGRITKDYLVLVCGKVSRKRFSVDAPLRKNVLKSGERIVRVDPEGKPSLTRFKCVQQLTEATLLEARLETGRTHQIRVHTAHSGHPIAGDDKYGERETNRHFADMGLNRLFLHAVRIGIKPEKGGQQQYMAELPNELQQFLNKIDIDRGQ